MMKRSKKLQKRHEEKQLQRERRRFVDALRKKQAAEPIVLRWVPRTEQEEARVRQVCLEKATLEGKTGFRRRERAEQIYREVVAEAKNRVRLLPGDGVVQHQTGPDLPRTPGGIFLPYGPSVISKPEPIVKP